MGNDHVDQSIPSQPASGDISQPASLQESLDDNSQGTSRREVPQLGLSHLCGLDTIIIAKGDVHVNTLYCFQLHSALFVTIKTVVVWQGLETIKAH